MDASIFSIAPADNAWAYCRRALDVVLSILILLLVAPILVAIGLAIRLDTPGPVMFRQRRVGRFEEPFTIFKFRTMVNRADETFHRKAINRMWAGERLSEDSNAPYKLNADPRITRVGRWLRKTSLDELPQLLNVLRGEMSLVGPRPMIPYELEHLQAWHHERHFVRPGITGLSQVSSRGRAKMEDMLRLDVEYVRNQSLRNDFKLILLTIPIVLRGIGAR